MPVHDMTRAASSIVGQPATGSHARCPECGYGTVLDGCGAAILVHSAVCPSAEAVITRRAGGWVACRLTSCKAVLDPRRVDRGATVCNEKHRAAAWKSEHSYGRHDAVVASGRANGSQRRKKPSGAQVSWRKAVHALAGHLLGNSLDGVEWSEARAAEACALTMAAEILRPALSDRQRAQLDAKEQETAND